MAVRGWRSRRGSRVPGCRCIRCAHSGVRANLPNLTWAAIERSIAPVGNLPAPMLEDAHASRDGNTRIGENAADGMRLAVGHGSAIVVHDLPAVELAR